ncbi:GNAT family N-acetyltransferase [Streptomyces sp. NPDC020983]|uniref:GNAT family N-acetyltransferase n=1 Tax=Streptomyces sp. NPDC020983 TaxID=3365106 RepID=UPI003787DF5A
MTIELRALAESEWEAYERCLLRSFGGPGEDPAEAQLWRELLPVGRTVTAWDGKEIVGTAGAFDFRMAVPGGALRETAGVTAVSVLPTHRRRGVLTAMMRRQLDTFHADGTPLAVLTASEPQIYGRFGYGAGTRQVHGSLDVRQLTVALPPGAERLRMRLVDPAEGSAACEAVYAQVVPRRPGMLARRPGWERHPLLDPASGRGGFGPMLCVLAEDEGGEVRGYARYWTSNRGTPEGVPDGTVKLRDVEALDPAAYAALWHYLTGTDLTARLVFHNRPADDPVQQLVSDIRRCHLGWRDGLYVRLVDVPAALAARAYTAPLDVVLEVEDAFCPWNSGRWRLSADASGAVCERTAGPADLAVTARELGTAYLGGHTLRTLAAAGLVTELRPGALGPASAAFHCDVQPWVPHGF